jgi:hypothetical protein
MFCRDVLSCIDVYKGEYFVIGYWPKLLTQQITVINFMADK